MNGEGRTTRIAVFASGGGSNLQALLEYLDTLGTRRGGTVVLVASDRPGAPALERAASRSISSVHVAQPSEGGAISEMLDAHGVGMIALAGYLKLIPPEVTRRYRGRIVNIHPALLPAFGGPGMYGLRAHRAVLAAGARLSGASAHFVDESYDRGALIAQWPVPVLPADSAESLAARVLRVEHLLYPRVVDAVARGSVTLGDDGRVRFSSQALQDGLMFALGLHPADSVAHTIDLTLQ